MLIQDISWFFKYRPVQLSEYVFPNIEYQNIIYSWVKNNKIPGNIILYGPQGTGKTSLNKLLQKTFLKNNSDLKDIKSRSVTDIDDLRKWIMQESIGHTKKIIAIEEIDQLSTTARSELKKDIMEFYQDHVVFIATTNFVNLLDSALLDRFTFKFHMSGTPNKQGTYDRLHYILTTEKIKFNKNDLQEYVKKNTKNGLRDLINNIQCEIVDNKIDIAQINIQTTAQEEIVVKNTKDLIETVFMIQDSETLNMLLINPINTEIGAYYTSILEITRLNKTLNYSVIFQQLEEIINFIPIKLVIDEYLNKIKNTIIPSITYIAFIAKIISVIIESNIPISHTT